ncbi:MAG: hypothetical protein ACI9CD_000706 [Candidatus Deianiraeaceae bacterium]|jgi:hypothetical protein
MHLQEIKEEYCPQSSLGNISTSTASNLTEQASSKRRLDAPSGEGRCKIAKEGGMRHGHLNVIVEMVQFSLEIK